MIELLADQHAVHTGITANRFLLAGGIQCRLIRMADKGNEQDIAPETLLAEMKPVESVDCNY